MTPIQFDRWKDFALRMARTCFTRQRRPDAKWIEEAVEDFFGSLDENDVPCIVDWDNSTGYSVGNPNYGREYHKSYCSCKGPLQTRHELGKPNPVCPECRGTGLANRVYSAGLVCDTVTSFLDSYRCRDPVCKACEHADCRKGWPHYEDSCQLCNLECRCDEIEQLAYDQWDDQWGGPVSCCIRAGLDCASAPSAGVVGFTAGDVRRMYPEGVPEWVFAPDERLHYWLSDEVNGTFRELPDEAGVVL